MAKSFRPQHYLNAKESTKVNIRYTDYSKRPKEYYSHAVKLKADVLAQS